jgi:hypothetical protein
MPRGAKLMVTISRDSPCLSMTAVAKEQRRDQQEYSLWEHDSNVVLLTAEATFMQRVHYIHRNPLRAGLVEQAEDYRWSSVRYWNRCIREDEPLRVDVERIVWRSAK